ncbi:hypothetical protein WUBG_14648 [Wuchereria bancrofti]|uniref:Uncharacterized protein n=1 Tax=Wuchereria bancrofti TaxID=6293 RepID=J9DXI8_WUCBA|nr:hypothetical protein WUBG_14648 [Wuchereria bancrofti]
MIVPKKFAIIIHLRRKNDVPKHVAYVLTVQSHQAQLIQPSK